MALTVYSGDSYRIVWKTDRPPVDEPVASPEFSVSGLNFKLKFWRVHDKKKKESWIILLLKSEVTSVFREGCVKIYIVNKFGCLVLMTDYFIPNTLNPALTEILRISTEEIKDYADAVCKDKVTLVFDFWFANISETEKTAALVNDVHKPSSSPVNSCTESLLEDLQKLLEEGSHHDLELKCGDRSISAHKSILTVRSTVFAAMLRNDMQEGRSGVVDITDIEFPVLQYFLRYVYSGTLPELTVEVASSLFKAGDKYAVKALMKRCAQFLVESLTVDNACEFLALAEDHGDKEFKESVISYILDKKVPKEYGDWTQFCSSRPMLGLEVLNRYVFKN